MERPPDVEHNAVFWRFAVLEPGLARAAELLSRTASDAEHRAALTTLLTSDSTPAHGVALDFVALLHAGRRHGDGGRDLIDAVRPAARECALRELSAPPYEGSGQVRPGANHASAFSAMWHMVTPADAPLLARALAANRDPQVLERGLMTAETLLYDADDTDPHLARTLLAMLEDRTLPVEVRTGALSALGVTAGETWTPRLEQALEDPDPVLVTVAALLLLQRDTDRYRARITTLAASWPPADEATRRYHADIRALLGA